MQYIYDIELVKQEMISDYAKHSNKVVLRVLCEYMSDIINELHKLYKVNSRRLPASLYCYMQFSQECLTYVLILQMLYTNV